MNAEPIRVLRLLVEDFMNIIVADVTLDPSATQIVVAGENEAGKTSLLNSVATIVEGVSKVTVNGARPNDLVRHGAKQATIKAELGNENGRAYTVERILPADGKPTLRIKGAAGVKVPSTQAFMDDLAGRLGLDPGAFLAMGPTDQFNEVCRIAGLDFDEIDGLIAAAAQKRSELTASAKQAEAAADRVEVPAGLPAKRVDVAKKLDELKALNEKNAAIAAEVSFQEEARRSAERHRAVARDALADLDERVKGVERAVHFNFEDIDRQIAELQSKRTKAAADGVREVQRLREQVSEKSKTNMEAAGKIETDLGARPALELPAETDDLEQEISNADEINRGIAQRERRDELEAETRRMKEAAEEQAAQVSILMERKRKMIAEVGLPVKGIGFGDKIVTLDDVPLKQASDGRQWRAACEISIAGSIHRELRLLLIRRASLITEKNRGVIVETAKEHQVQVWFEFAAATSDAQGAIIMKEGRVKQ